MLDFADSLKTITLQDLQDKNIDKKFIKYFRKLGKQELPMGEFLKNIYSDNIGDIAYLFFMFQLTGEYINFAKTIFSRKKYKKLIINFKNGYMHGLAYGYYPNGNITHRRSFQNNLAHGVDEGYYKNGNIKWRMNNVNDALDGLAEIWHKNGCLSRKINYRNGAAELEERTCYYKNGNVKCKISYVNSKLHGIQEAWDKNGNKLLEANTENNRLINTKWYCSKLRIFYCLFFN